jgi:carbon storage regulator CsrA
MLILTRYVGESIIIHTDDGLVVKVKLVQRNPNGSDRIGIEAPPHVHVDREEIYARKIAEKTPS